MTARERSLTPCGFCWAIGRHLSHCESPEATGLHPTAGAWTCLGCDRVSRGSFVVVGGKRRCVGCGAHAAIGERRARGET